MKRILIVCGALVPLAALGVSSLPDTSEPGLFAAATPQDRSVVVRRVYEGLAPDFWGTSPSPDGRYVTQTDWVTGDLAVLDLLTGEKRRVTAKENGWVGSSAYNEMARFSPDGERIAYSWYAEPGTYELRVIDTDGTNSRLVTRASYDPDAPRYRFEWWPDLHGWSPDGEHILVTFYTGPGLSREEQVEIRLVSVTDGSMEILHKPELGRTPRFAGLSPDGRFLAFDENRVPWWDVGSDPMDANMDVFVKPLAGGPAERVAHGPATDLFLGWTDDGDVLVYSDRELTESVWRIPMQGGRPAGEPTRIAGDLWGMQPIGVAGDNLFYGVSTQAQRIQVVPLDLTRSELAGPPTPVEAEMRRSMNPAFSPDGSQFMYMVGERRGGQIVNRLMLRSMAGGETREVTPDNLQLREFGRWSEDGRRVLIEAVEDARVDWFAYTLETGATEHVLPRDALNGLEIRLVEYSSDWSTLYLAATDETAGTDGIRSVNVSTGEQRTLLARPSRPGPGPTFMGMALSPDDRRLAFVEWSEGRMRSLKVVSTHGGEERTLLTESHAGVNYSEACRGLFSPLWTSDGRHLLITLSDSTAFGDKSSPNPCKLHKVPVDGGEPIFVGNIPQYGGKWTLSPDDRRLAITTGENRGEIWIMRGLSAGR